MLRNPSERRAVCRVRARCVVFGTDNLRIARMIELFAEHLPLNCTDIQPATFDKWPLSCDEKHALDRMFE